MVRILFLIACLISSTVPALSYATNNRTTKDRPSTSDPRDSTFNKIGDKYYFVDDQNKSNWFAAAHRCRQLGGDLWNIENELELNKVSEKLNRNHSYWTSGNDLALPGAFYSIATGKLVSFVKWSLDESSHIAGNCIELSAKSEHLMNVTDCHALNNFICEKSPRTISVSILKIIQINKIISNVDLRGLLEAEATEATESQPNAV